MGTAKFTGNTLQLFLVEAFECNLICMPVALNRKTPCRVPSLPLRHSVSLYAAETWTLLAADLRSLEVLRMRCQRQILGIRWTGHICNAPVPSHAGLDHVSRRKLPAIGTTSQYSAILPGSERSCSSPAGSPSSRRLIT